MPDVMKTILLNPPSFENFDGGASSRWPATREIESYWYPVWLSYPAGMIPGSRLLDASHASLRDLYEVSTPAVETAVERLQAAGALGARIMGGGFGGHVLGLLPPGAVPPPGSLEVRPGRGARLVSA